MKAMNHCFKRIGRASVLAVALATAPGFAPALPAQETGSARGGAAKLMPKTWNWWETKGSVQLRPITSAEDVAALKDGDLVAMACPKCKTITMAYAHTEKGHIQTTTTGQLHLCPGCDSRLVTEGYGHQAKTRLVHTCKACGSTDVFCCVMTQGEGPSKGMEPK